MGLLRCNNGMPFPMHVVCVFDIDICAAAVVDAKERMWFELYVLAFLRMRLERDALIVLSRI